jgi:hypothetical protein
MTKVVGLTTIIWQEVHRAIGRYVLGIFCNKFCQNVGVFDMHIMVQTHTFHRIPWCHNCRLPFIQSNGKTWPEASQLTMRWPQGMRTPTVHIIIITHKNEWVIIKVAEELDIRSRLIVKNQMQTNGVTVSVHTLLANSIYNSAENHVCRKTNQRQNEYWWSQALTLGT